MAFTAMLCAALVALTSHSVSAQGRCAAGQTENISVASAWRVRGIVGRYYPSLPFSGFNLAAWPPTFSDLNFARIDATPEIPQTGVTLNDFGAVGEDASRNPATISFMREKYATIWQGSLAVPCTGEYIFRATSDDGARVRVDNNVIINNFVAHQPAVDVSKPVVLTANTLIDFRVEFFQGPGSVILNLEWKAPGMTTFERLPRNYLVPHSTPAIIAVPSVIKLVSDAPPQQFCVRLSMPPKDTVYVSLSNIVTGDMIGFDKCQLVFTPDNWETPQCVRAAINPTAVANRRYTGVVPIFLNGSSFQPEWNIVGAIQTVNPQSLYSVDSAECYSAGDPHYVTFDKKTFDFQGAGTYTLMQTTEGDIAIQTTNEKCGGAGAACTKFVWIYYRGAHYTVYVSSSTEPVTGRIQGGDPNAPDLAVVTRPAGNTVVYEFPDLWVRVDGYNWNGIFMNVRIRPSKAMASCLLGLCGNYNANPADDPVDYATLQGKTLVPINQMISSGLGGNLQPVTCPARPPTAPIIPPDFTFDPRCSSGKPMPPNPTPNPPPGPITPPPIPPPQPNPQPPPPPIPPTANVTEACKKLFSSISCPYLPADQLAAQIQFCIVDAMALNRVPDPNNPEDQILLEPFKQQCDFQKEQKECAKCTATQTCINATCVNVIGPCGAGCLNGGKCGTDGVCVCVNGWTGKYCSVPPPNYAPCTPNPCKNDGVCVAISAAAFQCNCGDGWYGATCATDVNECFEGVDTCDPNAACANTNGSFTCTCRAPFIGDGVFCTQPATVYGNICVDTNNDGKCDTTEKPIGSVQVTITDPKTNKTVTGSTNANGTFTFPNLPPGTYIVTVNTTTLPSSTNRPTNNPTGTATVTITSTGTIPPVVFTYGDVDECTMKTHKCAVTSVCTNTDGSYTCACGVGFTGNGINCTALPSTIIGTVYTDVNANGLKENGEAPVANVTVALYGPDGSLMAEVRSDANGKYEFAGVPPGTYIIRVVTSSLPAAFNVITSPANGTATVTVAPGSAPPVTDIGLSDTNECMAKTHNCGANAQCTNTIGSFTCACLTGYTGNGLTCADADECNSKTHNCAAAAICTNTAGSFTCACQANFVGNGINCAPAAPATGSVTGNVYADINGNTQWDSTDSGIGSATVNLIGPDGRIAFTTTTPANGGYTFPGVPVGTYTVRIDTNTVTGGFRTPVAGRDGSPAQTATVAGGAAAGPINFGFVDTNECATGTHKCAASNSICTNTAGSYTCRCEYGYTGNGTVCLEVNACLDMVAMRNCDGNSQCMQNGQMRQWGCQCNAGFVPGADKYTCIFANGIILPTAPASNGIMFPTAPASLLTINPVPTQSISTPTNTLVIDPPPVMPTAVTVNPQPQPTIVPAPGPVPAPAPSASRTCNIVDGPDGSRVGSVRVTVVPGSLKLRIAWSVEPASLETVYAAVACSPASIPRKGRLVDYESFSRPSARFIGVVSPATGSTAAIEIDVSSVKCTSAVVVARASLVDGTSTWLCGSCITAKPYCRNRFNTRTTDFYARVSIGY